MNELEERTKEEDFWNEPATAAEVMQKASRLRETIEEYEKLEKEIEDLEVLGELSQIESALEKELEEEIKRVEQKIEQMELETLFSGPYDQNNAILTLHAGAGGTEAQDWAQMLLRMYTRWAEKRGYKIEVLDYLAGEEAGIKSATLLIKGKNVYGLLKGEQGVHRLVRISPFDAAKRRHTSFASVEVLPEVRSEEEVEIDSQDLRIDTYRSSGAGGQHVNKTDSAVRITHLPTGIVVQCQNERSQHANKEVALKILQAKLLELKRREEEKILDNLKGDQQEIAWGSQIRSYIFQPYTLVKDHRTKLEIGNVEAVMDGEIDPFLYAYLKYIAPKEAAFK